MMALKKLIYINTTTGETQKLAAMSDIALQAIT